MASSFRNVDKVRYVARHLEDEGYMNTYDWTKNAKSRAEEKTTFENLRSIGQKEKDAVLAADIVVILLPGGKGTHVELGIAIGQGKRVLLHSPDNAINNFDTTSTFYHLPQIERHYGTIDELFKEITGRDLLHTGK